jgi:TatD DNase family protein
MTLVDTHAHLDQDEFDADRDAVLRRAKEAGVEAIVAVGVTADSSCAVLDLAERHPEIHAAVGIQPNHAGQAAPGDWDRIVALAGHPRTVALGETGLDRYWDFTPLDVQRDYFDRHLRLAQRIGLPVVIHCREADKDLLPMLREAAARRPWGGPPGPPRVEGLSMLREAVARGPLRGVLHSFSGDAAMAAECLDLGLHLSFAGPATYRNRKFEPLREVAATAPLDRLLLETDSPYLVPEPFRGKQKRNEPALLVHTAARLAEIRGMPAEDLHAATTANARRLFGIGR